MRYAGGIAKGKDVLQDLLDSYVAMNRMACMHPIDSKERSFYLGKVQAYEDAIMRVRTLITGDGYDDKWYFNEDDVRECDGE